MAAEKILASGVTEILKKLSSVIAEEIGLAWGVKDELKKLQSTLEMIAAVSEDAETKQVKDKVVRLWLRRLKDIAYDADDILDDFSYETLRRREMDSLKYKVREFVSSSNPLAFRFKLARKIKCINQRLDEVAKDKDRFQLQPSASTSADQSSMQRNRQTSSFVDDFEIVGRENDKSKVVELLINSSSSANSNQCEKVSVISIVGMGGLGKTTLAQQVYKDDLVKKHFEPRIWTCVSEDFDVNRLLREIIESITEAKCDYISNFDVLVRRVHEKLTGNKFLLVLDDLWNENVGNWEKLRRMLTVGAHGSRILVTTRKDKVASIVQGTISPYNLKKLSDDECWSIIKQKAFFPGGALETPNMVEIGEEIAKKCGGLPLAANTLGSLMHLKKEETEWLSIRENEVWEIPEDESNIIPILKLSYDHLPSHLKQCFAYCSLFPKDWEINKETLIRLWMAEGFLHSSNERNKKSMEDIGNEYFERLLFNSFFQDVVKDEFGDIQQCKMHDLIHDLAVIVAGDHECSTLKANETENIFEVRRLRLDFDEGMPRTFPSALYNTKKIRTIFSLHPRNDFEVEGFFNNSHLRILNVCGSWNKKLPASMAKIRHLRYLDLSCSQVSGVLHAQFINSLYNLQTLVLHNCYSLYELSGDFGCLRNLRHLDLSTTQIKVLPDSITRLYNLRTLNLSCCHSLEALPENIGALKQLTCLDISNASSLKLLPDHITGLDNLRTLKLGSCHKVTSLPTDFGALKFLRCLDVFGTSIKVLPESCSKLNNLEMVQLGSCELPKEITNWKKLKHFTHLRNSDEMPRGIAQLTCLQTLQTYFVRKEVREHDCGGIEELGNLNLLQKLKIRDLKNVRSELDAKGANLKGKQNIRVLELDWSYDRFQDERTDLDSKVLEELQPHSTLKILKISHFMGVKIPMWMSVPLCLPNLVELRLCFCNKCTLLPAIGKLPCLQVLGISYMHNLKYIGDELYGGPTATAIAFPSLVELTIDTMDNLETWVGPPPLSYSFPCLEKMEIRRCQKLTITPTLFPSLKELKLNEVNLAAVSSITMNLTSLSSLSLSHIRVLDSEAVSSIMRRLTSLTSLSLNNLPKLTILPVALLQNNNSNNLLQHLKIEDCPNFQGFHSDWHNNEVEDNASSSTLRTLELHNCPAVTSMPIIQGWKILWGDRRQQRNHPERMRDIAEAI